MTIPPRPDQPSLIQPLLDSPSPGGAPSPGGISDSAASSADPAASPGGPRVIDPVTGWDRASVITALTNAARREREAKVDQLVLIARAAQVWSWVDNIDEVIDQIRTADGVSDTDTRHAIADAAEAGDIDLLDDLLGPTPTSGRGPAVTGERLWRYGAEGTPQASEFLRLEVGPALGISPDAAARLIGDVLDLRHRLPGLWGQLEADRIQGWVACQVARKTRLASLATDLCAELDRRIAPWAPGWTANKILSQTDRLIILLDPDTAEARRRQRLAERYVRFWTDRHPDGSGVLQMHAQLDAIPAADLEATLNALADVLETVEPDTCRDVLRARALELLADPARAAAILTGDITTLEPPHGTHPHNTDAEVDTGQYAARQEAPGQNAASQDAPGQDAADRAGTDGSEPDPAAREAAKPDSNAAPGTEDGGVPGSGNENENDHKTPDAKAADAEIPDASAGVPTPAPSSTPTGREVALMLHVNPADLQQGAGAEHHRLGVLVRSLLNDLLAHAAKVVVKPVIDPMAVSVSESATPPPAMRERVQLRNPTVVFPYSDRASTSRYVDLDHSIPRPEGPTTEPNLGPLDRRSHRWKTHTTARLEQIRNGTFRWTTPAGQVFFVTPHGTFTHDPGAEPPKPPPGRTLAQQTHDLINRAREAYQRAQHPDPDDPPF